VRVAVTADLHWGINDAGDAATRLLVAALVADPPDLLVLAGDQGAGDEFEPSLALFDGLDCRKALVPGNHDIWVTENDVRGDSLTVYREHLPALSVAHGFHYLDHSPLVLPDAELAVVGSINWYDYSWADPPRWLNSFPTGKIDSIPSASRAAGTMTAVSCAGRSTTSLSPPKRLPHSRTTCWRLKQRRGTLLR